MAIDGKQDLRDLPYFEQCETIGDMQEQERRWLREEDDEYGDWLYDRDVDERLDELLKLENHEISTEEKKESVADR